MGQEKRPFEGLEQQRKLLSPAKAEELLNDVENLAPQLNSYINSKRKRIPGG